MLIFPYVPGCATCDCAYADACVVRTNSYNYISGFYFLASVGGSWIGSLLLSQHVYLLNGLSIACFALTAGVSASVPSHCGRDGQVDESPALMNPDQEDDNYDNARPLLGENAVVSDDFTPKVVTFRSFVSDFLGRIYADCYTQPPVLCPSHPLQFMAQFLPINLYPLFNLFPNIYNPTDLPPQWPCKQSRSAPTTVRLATPIVASRKCERSHGIEKSGLCTISLHATHSPQNVS